MSPVPERSGVDEGYKWSLDGICASDKEWEAAYEDVAERIPELASYEGRATRDLEALLELFETMESVLREVSMVVLYANLRSSQGTRDQEYQTQAGRVEALVSKARSAVSYLDPGLQELGRDDVAEFVEKESELDAYEHYFGNMLRTKGYTRSTEVGEVLADLLEVIGTSSDIYSMLADADLEFPTVKKSNGTSVEITQSSFTKLQRHPDHEFRRTIHEEFYDRWADIRNAVGTSLKNSIKKDMETARVRDYETAREAALGGPNVPVEVYDNLLDIVRDNLGHLHRHAELRHEVIGADELRIWDLYVSLTGDHSLKIPYEQAKEYIVGAVEPLDGAYQERVTEGFDDYWVDVYENRGKHPGIYSMSIYDTQPLIMMNYRGGSASMFTLAHELGCSMHSGPTNDTQPWHDASYGIFTAEITSTVNETLLTEYLLESVDDDELRVHVLGEYLERFRSTLFRRTMFADFELRIYEIIKSDDALTPDRFDELYGDPKKTYYEPAATDDYIARGWEQTPHFYYGYYVYQYTTSIPAATAIVERIHEEGESTATDYHEALALGGNEYPLGMLRTAGVDITEPEPIGDTMSVYAGFLDEAAMLLGPE